VARIFRWEDARCAEAGGRFKVLSFGIGRHTLMKIEKGRQQWECCVVLYFDHVQVTTLLAEKRMRLRMMS
jgi:hypothetical protein